MKIVIIVLIVVAAVVAILLIIAAFTAKQYRVERSITINKPKAKVFAYIVKLKNQDNFSRWATMDPGMDKEYRGTDGTVGFVSAWKSENKDVGHGEQEITGITEGERVDYELRFLWPMKSVSDAYLITEATSDSQTKVTWGFEGEMKYPMNIMLLFMNMESLIGKDFETGLQKLKKILEA